MRPQIQYMRILVTGANGFVGRALCSRLSELGWAVRASVRRNVAALGENVMAVGNIDSHTDWSSALADIEYVVHLAARVHVMRETAADPLAEFRRVNVAGTRELARSAAQAGVKRLLFLSTIKVNGEETRCRPFCEADTPRPEDAYGISKWEAEQALHEIARDTGLEVVILRPPLVYGPGVKGNFLSLLAAVAKGIPLPLGAIKNHRSLVYVGNLVDAILRCLTHPTAAGETFLVSDGEPLSTPTLVHGLAAALGRPARLLPVPPRLLELAAYMLGKGDSIQRLTRSLELDTSKIRKTVGWTPAYSMAEGLAETMAWYMSSRGRTST